MTTLVLQPRLAEAERPGMARQIDIPTTAALFECGPCGREVDGFHADCDSCYEAAPDVSPLERCDHYVCRRCGEEL